MDAATAYRMCEGVTRRRARNFYYGIRLLPEHKRRALCAIYAFARRVDDVGDGSLPPSEKLRRLTDLRIELATLERRSDEPTLVALADAVTRFPLPLDAFVDLVDGVEMDVRGERYDSRDELVVYCHRVAGSIGRLSLGVFGAADRARAEPLADALGVALQLTNILRDVQEDRLVGRVYLPAEDLRRFRCAPDLSGPPKAVELLVGHESAWARAWFDQGLKLLPLLDRRSAACAGAMAGIYRRILVRISRRPQLVLGRRVSLPAWEKAWVASRCVVGGRP